MYLGLAIIALSAPPVLASDRLTDKDVKSLVERIDDGRGKFKDGLDDDFKKSIRRGPGGEVNVAKYLDDFKESIDKLKDRLKPEYAASAEVANVLRLGSGIERAFGGELAGQKGQSEWNRLAGDLKTLAAAYGADFPLTEGAPVRRVGDKELAGIVEHVAKGTEGLKKSIENDLKKNTSVDKPTRDGFVKEADECSKDAKNLRDRLKDSQPSSGEADRLLACASQVQTFLGSHPMPSSTAAFNALAPRLKDIAGAYRTTWGETK
jgi:hypothetical protein